MIAQLKTELATGNYDGMTDSAVATALNAPVSIERKELTTGAIYNCIVPAEFTALTADQKQLLRDILGLGAVDVSTGTNARAVLLSLFPGGTGTLANLAAAVTTSTTRAAQIGISQTVMDYHVTEARNG